MICALAYFYKIKEITCEIALGLGHFGISSDPVYATSHKNAESSKAPLYRNIYTGAQCTTAVHMAVMPTESL